MNLPTAHDEPCPFCHGSGECQALDPITRRKFGCLGCNGSGLYCDFAARLLSGIVQVNEEGSPFEPHADPPYTEEQGLRSFYGPWKFTGPKFNPKPK